jgi:hypothetical protein
MRSLGLEHVTGPVPVQFFQSVIAIELAITGALLFQIRYFQPRHEVRDDDKLPKASIRVFLALVLLSTGFGSLLAIVNGGGEVAASLVTVGVAVSAVPILLRALPPVTRNWWSRTRDHDSVVTVVGLGLYALVVSGTVAALNV